MIDLKTLWIGDTVEVKSTGKAGTFVGRKGNQALIKIDDQIFLIAATNLILRPEKEEPISDEIEKFYSKKPTTIADFDPILDLHLATLEGYEQSGLPTALDYQLSRCRSFIELAVSTNVPEITIIHGKGQGVLKAAVDDLLRNYDEVVDIIPIHQGGAVKVTFR